MNVLKEQTAVLRLAQTQLEAIRVPVTQATAWQPMDKCAMVSHNYCIQLVNYIGLT